MKRSWVLLYLITIGLPAFPLSPLTKNATVIHSFYILPSLSFISFLFTNPIIGNALEKHPFSSKFQFLQTFANISIQDSTVGLDEPKNFSEVFLSIILKLLFYVLSRSSDSLNTRLIQGWFGDDLMFSGLFLSKDTLTKIIDHLYFVNHR